MPLVRIDMIRGRGRENVQAIADAVQQSRWVQFTMHATGGNRWCSG